MKNIGILYFSSTGNNLYIAKKIKEVLGGEIKYIPKYHGDGLEYSAIFIVTPIYSFGLPVPVFELLSKLNKKTGIFVIQSYGGMICGADSLFYKYATECGLNVKSIYTIKMPENFTLVMSPPEFYKKAILKSADKRIGKIIEAFRKNEFYIPKNGHTKEETYLKNKSNWHLIGEAFSVTDKCVKCQKCVSICPVGNIKMNDGNIEFGNKCIACLGCFHRCPQSAIIYKNKDNKKRYINPNINDAEIGKDID